MHWGVDYKESVRTIDIIMTFGVMTFAAWAVSANTLFLNIIQERTITILWRNMHIAYEEALVQRDHVI